MNRAGADMSRRALLKSLGVGAACLPLLREGRAQAATPRRLICALQIGGYIQASWRPPVGPLAGQPLPPSCLPLEPIKGDLIFLPDLTYPSDLPGASNYGTMFYGLPDVVGPTAYREPNGPTVDQVVGAQLANGRPASLALGVQLDRPPRASIDPGASRAFWAGAGRPISPQLSPYDVYATLFGGGVDPAAVKRLILEKKSILDYVGSSLDQFKGLLGKIDRERVDLHLQSLRDFEVELQSAATSATQGCGGSLSPPNVALSDGNSYPLVLKLQMDLLVMALACGVTPVATLQLSDAVGSNVTVISAFLALGQRASWRALARDGSTAGVAAKQAVDRWCMEELAILLNRLAATPDGAGSLLDSTVVLWANTVDDGRSRNAQKLPWILATGAGGFFKTGQCAASAGTPSSGVLAEICNALGVTNHPFGAPLVGLRA